MKKSLIALAALAASGFVMAQSSVTMFGIVDTGLAHVSTSGQSSTGLLHSGNSTSRLGFRGVEDLGGGLKAGFWLEGAIQPDTGGGAGGGAVGPGFEFKRRSTVQLSGNFGEVRLGRELTAGYTGVSGYDVFGQVGLAAIQGMSSSAGSRVSNGVSYLTPGNLGGFSAMAHYGFGESTVSNSTNRYVGLNVGYNNGPLSIGASYDKQNGAPASTYRKHAAVGASYNFGVVKPSALYLRSSTDNNVGEYAIWALGVTAPVGPGKIAASYTRYDQKGTNADSNAFAVGYVYDLSKRTAVYGTIARMQNKNGAAMNLSGAGGAGGIGAPVAAAGRNVTGYQVGVRHNF